MSGLHLIGATLLPVFSLIALGTLLRRAAFPGDGFWPLLEQLIYYLLFPALLVHALATTELDPARSAPMAAAIAVSLLSISAALLAVRPRLPVDGAAFTSVYQGAIRFNTYLGVAVAFALFGPPGAAVAALILTLKIPLVNVLCVAVLARYTAARVAPRAVLRAILHNPLILACMAGLVLNLSQIGLPLGSDHVLGMLAQAALPLGLLAVGAGLSLRLGSGQLTAIAGSTIVKLLLLPAVAWIWAQLLALEPLERQLLIAFCALPTAPAGYILARQMGGDHRLFATLLTVQTALAALTLPFWLFAAGSL